MNTFTQTLTQSGFVTSDNNNKRRTHKNVRRRRCENESKTNERKAKQRKCDVCRTYVCIENSEYCQYCKK